MKSLIKTSVLILIVKCVCILGATIPPDEFSTTESEGLSEKSSAQSREEVLDPNGKYTVIWDTDFEAETITFQITVKTLGWVGFGISPNGGMKGADIVMGGVYPNGTSYFSDYFGVGTTKPELDEKQDWELLEAKENGTHTMLKIQRLFNTCDQKDFKIGNDTSSLIWTFGKTDEIGYHLSNRGSFSVNLLDPPMPQINTSDILTWRVSNEFEMPADETTYWCTLYKGPAVTSKHHMVGFEAYLPTPEALEHTHHFVLHECRSGGKKEEFHNLTQELLNSEGDHCYIPGKATGLTFSYCSSYLLVWATGGKRATFPENAGYALSSQSTSKDGEDVYYMLQVHYNNPGGLKGVKFEAGVDILYTSKLREFDATTLQMGHEVTSTQIIPPKTKSFTTVGHCSAECTQEGIPKEGVNIFNVMLHSHIAGRKIKLRHYRGGEEIAWMANDENYNFDFQQNRPMRKEIKLMPGDHLALECVYETMTRENVTLGGFSTQEEMCQAFLMYYPKVDMWFCGSSLPYHETFKYFGIQGIKWVPGTLDFDVTEPKKLAGEKISTVINRIDWTPEKVKEVQSKARFSPHESKCHFLSANVTTTRGKISYPNVTKEYHVEDSCKVN